MKKILLIEDRIIRQKFFMNKTKIFLDKYSDVLDNKVDEEYDELELQLEKDNFNFQKYDYVISHKSAFGNKNSECISKIKEICKKEKIPLVLFSGGISTNYYDTSDGEVLELNSKTFYSSNLELFLETSREDKENIFMLSYGELWKQNVVSNMLEKINIFLGRNDKNQVGYGKFIIDINIKNLNKIPYTFYQMEENELRVNIAEIIKFRDSLYGYFDDINQKKLNQIDKLKTILIHNNNVVDPRLFDTRIKFTPNTSDIDEYITNSILPDIKDAEFDIIFIKDNLSDNYLELYGLRVAYHIRLSKLLEEKSRCPIVVISDLGSDVLYKFDPMAKILFTSNIYIIQNKKEDIEQFQNKALEKMTLEEYKEGFLSHIKIEPPKDYTDHHSITNEWAIHQWSDMLDVTSSAIKMNHDKMNSMLYFKYLKALHFSDPEDTEKYTITQSQKKGKILYIDDEWNKGWSDILTSLFKPSESIEFKTFEYEYKDVQKFHILSDIKLTVESENPDVVILDLRLSQTDHDRKDDIDDFTGIKILKAIHEINPGIQVIMMTATRQSVILEKLYDYGVLGYIKKEHPDDISVSTIENIDKLFTMVESGLERKYLKDIYITKSKILTILENDIFEQYKISIELYEPFWIQIQVEINQVFDILSSTTSQNKFKYAMVSIASSLEAILSIFIKEKRGSDNIYWDGEICKANTLNTKLNDLFYNKFGYEIKDQYRSKLKLGGMIAKRNDYLHSRSEFDISKDEIISWFNKFSKMIEIIQNPPRLRSYNTENLVENLSNAFKDR